ncbi:MAG: DUF354 domain-containing protein, partial [Nitrososphaerota archaeon]
MKILIDILTPKQALLFSKLTEKLRKRGHQVYATTRRYREVLQLLRLKGIEATVVGEHGGGTLINKLRASARRTLELSSLFEAILPDLSISFSSPEMARASYGLKVPHICVNDSPHAEAVARLTIPLSDKLLTPKMIPKRAWTRFGISPEQIVQYYALDPWVWLKDFKPDKRILQELGLDESKPILTFRTEESFAAYLLGKTGKEVSIIPVIRNLLGKDIDLQIVVVPRYDEHISALRQIFGDEVFICETVVDGANLLYHTSVFIGAGGTMSAEAVLLGVPTISCYPGEPTIIEE